MKYLNIILKELKRKITIILIHHGRVKPMRFSFSLPFLLVLIGCWTMFTLWAGFVSGQHIDYWKVKADNKIMKVRMLFFAEQIQKSREMLSQIKENDDHIRTLLAMKSKRMIIENGLGSGGPTPIESSALSTLLSGNMNSISDANIAQQSFDLLEEYKASMKSYSEVVQHISIQREKVKYTPSIWPCRGIITSPFGFRLHPLFRNKFFHTGMDIANVPNTPVFSTADGVVIFAGWQEGYGYVMSVEHGYKYRTVYAHLSKILVRKGQFVSKGQKIARMGNTGRSTGTHLHYEVHYNGRPVNPMKYLNSYLN